MRTNFIIFLILFLFSLSKVYPCDNNNYKSDVKSHEPLDCVDKKADNNSYLESCKRILLKENKIGGRNLLTQSMIDEPNKTYVFQYDFVINSDIKVPANCTLEFEGGSINGLNKIIFDKTSLQGNPSILCDFDGTIGNNYINVAWFGVIPNTDCNQRFQKVIDFYSANVPTNPWDFWPNEPEPKIVIPNGTFYLGTINLRSYLTIEGQGIGGTVLKNTYFKGKDIYHMSLSNLVFKNNSKTVSADKISLLKEKSYKIAIDIDHGSNIILNTVSINTYDIGIYINRCYSFETYSCEIKYCSIGLQGEGITAGDACHCLNIYGGEITAYNYGIVLNYGNGVNIGRTTLENGNYGFYSKAMGSVNMFNNYFEANSVADVYGSLSNFTFNNNYISNNRKTKESYFVYATLSNFVNIHSNLFASRKKGSVIPYIELANGIPANAVSVYNNDIVGTHDFIVNNRIASNHFIGDGFVPGEFSAGERLDGHLSVAKSSIDNKPILKYSNSQGSFYLKGDNSRRDRLIIDYSANGLNRDSEGDSFYQTADDIPVWWNGNNFIESDGAVAGVKRSGGFYEKPKAKDIYIGFRYFCTDRQTPEGKTNGIEIIHKGNNVWVDALGRQVK